MQNMVNHNARTINAQNAFYGCQGESKISHIDIRDVAAVATKALTENGHEGKVYTLTGPVALSNAQITRILSYALGRDIRSVDLPSHECKPALPAARLSAWTAAAAVCLH